MTNRNIIFSLLALAPGCLDVDDQTSSDSQQVIIGDNNLQDVEYYVPKPGSPFPKSYVDYYEPAVGLLAADCSGTLIGRDLFLTASHCVLSGKVQFHYQIENGVVATSDDYTVSGIVECGMRYWCGAAFNLKSTNAERDFAILRLAPKIGTGYPGDKYGWRQIETPDPAVLRQHSAPIALIQHPSVGPKKVDTGNVYRWDHVNMDWNADSKGGSSGSGVLDVNGSIIALNDSESTVDNYGPAMMDIRNISTVLKGPIFGNTYQLVKASDGNCLDVPAFSKTAGTQIAENGCRSSGYLANQQFQFVPFQNGSYEIVEHDSSLCVTLPPGTGSVAYLSSCYGASTQVFDVVQFGIDGKSSAFAIKSHSDATQCLNTNGIGSWLGSATCNTLSWWNFRQTKRTYRIQFAPTNLCLDMTGGSKADGVYPQEYACKTTPTDIFNQEWQLVPQLDGSVKILAAHSGKCLDLATPSTADIVHLVQATCALTATQRWRVIPNGNYYELQNVYSNKCVTEGSPNPVQMTCGTNDFAENFVLTPSVN